MLFKYTLVFSALIMLQACGTEPENLESNLKLTDQSTDGRITPQAEAKTLPASDEPSSFAAPELSKEPTEVSEVQTAQVSVQSEPVSEAKALFNAAGLETFLVEESAQSSVYCRERDQVSCEVVLVQVRELQPGKTWILLLRPNEEILTKDGFVSPPPSIADILRSRDVTDYELNEGVITVFARMERAALGAVETLKVFYPNVAWSVTTKPDPEPEVEPVPPPPGPTTDPVPTP